MSLGSGTVPLLTVLETQRGYSKFLGWQNFFHELPKGAFDIFKRWLWLQPIFPESFYADQPNLFLKVDSVDFLSQATILKLAPWSTIIPLILWFFIVYGLTKRKKPLAIKILAVFLLMIFLWQLIVNHYFYSGVRILTRRMNLIIGFLVAILFISGLTNFLKNKNGFISRLAKSYFAIFLISTIFITAYPSGPSLGMVTTNERRAAQYIWNQIQNQSTQKDLSARPSTKDLCFGSKFPEAEQVRYGAGKIQNSRFCVLASTWPLLALEEVSGRQIVAGGFPQYFEYQQPERVELFEKMNQDPSLEIMNQTIKITGADACYFMTEERWTNQNILNKIRKILGEPKIIGDVYIWQYNK